MSETVASRNAVVLNRPISKGKWQHLKIRNSRNGNHRFEARLIDREWSEAPEIQLSLSKSTVISRYLILNSRERVTMSLKYIHYRDAVIARRSITESRWNGVTTTGNTFGKCRRPETHLTASKYISHGSNRDQTGPGLSPSTRNLRRDVQHRARDAPSRN